MQGIDPFLINLSNTCKYDNVIIEDGTSQTIFGRIRDFFKKKEAADYFKVVCHKLSERVERGTIAELSTRDQINVLSRIKQISKKLKEKDQGECCLLKFLKQSYKMNINSELNSYTGIKLLQTNFF